MRFKLRPFLDALPWENLALLVGLLLAFTLVHAAASTKSKKPRCPTCNQIVKEAK